MPLTQPKINDLLALLRQRFPDWNGFDHPGFVEDEVAYKQATVARARELLSQDELERLIAEGQFDEFIARLEKIGQDNNLLWRSVPLSGDLGILYQPQLDKATFCPAVFDLLYGPDAAHQRLTRYTVYVKANGLPNKWTFPTYFLFVCHPDSEMFVKPRTTKWFIQFMDGPKTFTSVPTPPTYVTIKQIAQEVRDALVEYGPRDMVDIQSLIWVCASVSRGSENDLVSQTKRAEFAGLFHEFAETYPGTPEGQQHIAEYDRVRQQGQQNLTEIANARSQGQDVADLVLLKLLPYADSQANRQKGAWVHIAPSITGDLKGWFENVGWTRPADWPHIAQAILSLILSCNDDPEQLPSACQAFSALSYSKGFQTGMITPILNALRPDDYVLINNKSRQVFNYFANTTHSQKLTDYPAANATARELIEELAPDMDHPAVAALSAADRLDMFCHWLVAIKKHTWGSVSYWKIAPGEGAWNWEACRDGGFIAIGWEELGDLSDISRTEFDARVAQLLKEHPDWTKEGVEQNWRFAKEIKEGDCIVANRGTQKVLGIGTVVGSYEFVPGIRHGHRLPVEWDDLTCRQIDEPSWQKTLIRLQAKTFDKVSTAPKVLAEGQTPYQLPDNVTPNCPFTRQTFELLYGLHQDPTKSFYQAHKDELQAHLEGPFQQLFRAVVERLPAPVLDTMETGRRVFGRILKNDYGQGGAWSFYWGALYPKSGKRTEDAQLSMWINHECFEVGFYIGEYGSAQRQRFARNCQKHYPALIDLLRPNLSDERLLPGNREDMDVQPDGRVTSRIDLAWQDWLRDPAQANFDLSRVWSASQVLAYNQEILVDEIVEVYARLFPLVLLTISDDPLPAILRYLGVEEPDEEPEPNPPYPLAQCAQDTGLDEATLARWVRAIHRKGQAILYGPPGTGKTYLAEKLAQHMVSSGDGFVDLVQFHPAYAYEDFVQGIRPQERDDGGLSYPVVPGRFLEFCRQAAKRIGACVLIVDEINRANLSRVLGELMYLLEYRDKTIPLAAGGTFAIPANVRLVGTMNTADRSIALVDHALRRRFAFIALTPNYDVLRHYHHPTGLNVEGLIGVLKRLNAEIGDPHYHVGITFFLDDHLADALEDIWRMEIEPYLEEFFFDQLSKAQAFEWDKIAGEVMPK